MLLCAPVAARDWAVAMLDAGFAAHAAGDYPAARRDFARLAEQGSAVGETMLGLMHARGQGVRADPATAAGYFLRAANRGYAPAQLALARARATGTGVAMDAGDAWRWARIAETHGDTAVMREARALRVELMPRLATGAAAKLEAQARRWRPWPTLKR